MNPLRAHPLAALLLASAFLAPVSRGQATLLWHQTADGQSSFGPALLLSSPAFDCEIADDFDLSASISRVVMYSWSGGVGTFQGLTIRFYAFGSDGKPGALLQQYVFAPGDPAITFDPGLTILDAQLPTPFQASGHVFVAFEESVNPIWASSANTNNPTLTRFCWRDNLGGGGWVHHDLYNVGNFDADFAFDLYGTVTGAPIISSLSSAQLERSGRLVVSGSGFGGTQGSSTLTIGGLDAIVTRWSNTSIHAYVPEASALGSRNVQVVTPTGTSAPASLTVTARQAQGRMKWRFAIDSNYTLNRSAVAPDGSIYVDDVDGYLYKLAADGALLWVRATGPLGQTLGCQGPVAVGADGNVYVVNLHAGVASHIVSYAPDGTERWSFADPTGQGVIAGPSIGPDGNVYFATDFSGRGATALSPAGQMLWSNQGQPQIDEYAQAGEEIAFGPAQVGGSGASRMFTAFDESGVYLRNQLFAFDMAGGSQRFSVDTGAQSTVLSQRQGQPVVGPNGQVLLCSSWMASGWALSAFDPADGSVRWSYEPWPNNGLSEPVVGGDGATYLSHSASYLLCVNPDGTQRWQRLDTNASYGGPVISRDGAKLVVAGQDLTTYRSFVRGCDWDGLPVWTFDLGTEGSATRAASTRATVSNDSSTAYIGAWLAPANDTDPHGYVYAFDLGDPVAVAFCFGDGTQTPPCPCTNSGLPGHGCQNSIASGGSVLVVSGTASLSADTLVLTASGERPTALSIFLQGDQELAAVPFGDGLRCAGGSLKRLYTKSANSGAVAAPTGGESPVHVRSAAAGDSIPVQGTRLYQVYYRDPNPSYCPAPAGGTFNVSNGLRVIWGA